MTTSFRRIVSGLLAATALYAGAWAATAPASFFTSFPLPGHHWVDELPPYNEHLTRDVGGLYLALAVVTVAAVIRPRRDLLATVGLAWLVFGVPHLVFHALHLDGFDTADAIGSIVALAASVLGAVLLLPVRRPAATATAVAR